VPLDGAKHVGNATQVRSRFEADYASGEKRRLGEGAFGIVFEGKRRKTGELVALKELKVPGAKALAEVAIVEALRHPHIVRLVDAPTSGVCLMCSSQAWFVSRLFLGVHVLHSTRPSGNCSLDFGPLRNSFLAARGAAIARAFRV
jgi:serine/threonine protein kinase